MTVRAVMESGEAHVIAVYSEVCEILQHPSDAAGTMSGVDVVFCGYIEPSEEACP